MWGVPLGVGSICLLAAGVIATAGRMMWPRAVVALTLSGTAGILRGSFGPWLHEKITRAEQLAGPRVGEYTGLAVTVIAACIVLGFWGFWIYHQQIDIRTLGLTATIPLVVSFIPGAFGTVVIFVVGLVPFIVSGLVGLLIFGSWGG